MISFENISKSYENTKAVNNISFAIDKGELFGLIGPDGAGKSSIMRMLVTLLLADEGQITFYGKDIVSDYKYIRKHVGYMPGEFSLYQDLTVFENLEFFATVFNTSIDENYYLIRDIYEQLEPFKNRRAGALSGGMKQKLALCCALIHKPLVLVLDEPTTGVDAVSRKEFWEMLKRLKKHDITIIVSTPYLEEASLCDRVGLLNNGKMLDINTPERIVNSFSKKMTAFKTNNNYKALQLLRNYISDAQIYPFKDRIHITSEALLDEDKVLEYLHNNGLTEAELIKAEPDIEDCFMDLMLNDN